MLERLEQLAREAERMPWEKDASDVPYSVRAAFHDGITPEDVLKLIAVVKAAPYAAEVIEMMLHYIKPGTDDAAHAKAAAAALRQALVELER